jgi:hypothetical protein
MRYEKWISIINPNMESQMRHLSIVIVISLFIAKGTSAEDGSHNSLIDSSSSWCSHMPDQPGRDVETRATSTPSHSLAVIYLVPSNVEYSQAVYDRLVQSTLELQAWYQWATGGETWVLQYPEIVRRVDGNSTREFYLNNGNWWGPVFTELSGRGYPVWQTGTVTAIWAHGAGWWAGGAQCFDGNCGMALLGVEAFPEFNNFSYSGGNCPGGEGGAAWPCTPIGAYIHEVGHALGLPHPSDIPATSSVASHSVMLSHWNYPNYAQPSEKPWNLLRPERDTVLNNPFMHSGVELNQTFRAMDVVNLPALGSPPVANFSSVVNGLSVNFTNLTSGTNLFYWTFGDGGVSNEAHPSHTYSVPGTYSVTLRATNSDAMTNEASVFINLCCASQVGNVDCDPSDVVDIGDLTVLIDHLFINFPTLCCTEEANCDGANGIDIGDLTALVDHLFISFAPLAGCE